MKMVAADYGLCRSEARALIRALRIHRVLDGAAYGTGRLVRRETMRRLEADGLVSEDWAEACDGDGFTIQPVRERRCYALTPLGLDIAEQIDAAMDADCGDAGRMRHTDDDLKALGNILAGWREADQKWGPIRFADVQMLLDEVSERRARDTTTAPPVDNEHVAPGCEPFSDATIAAVRMNAAGSAQPCPRDGCKGHLRDRLTRDGSGIEGEECDACGAKWLHEYPRPIRGATPGSAPATVRGRPRIVCLCGSTRFKGAFEQANRDETMAGRIVLSVGLFGHADAVPLTDEDKRALDELHKRKIDAADEVLILNVGGYVGASTRSEIDYAEAHGKPIRWLEPVEIVPAGKERT